MIKLAAIGGGYSSEKEISLKSVQTILNNLDPKKYDCYKVIIDRSGWYCEHQHKVYEIDKNDFSIPELDVKFDFAFIMIHGTPGEDGKLQSYLDMVNIPYSTCDHLMTTLTFNKWACNNFVSRFGINCAKSELVRSTAEFDPEQIIANLGLPVFVKPNDGGSSFGVTKVKQTSELPKAIEKARSEGTDVIIESFLEGREITIGAMRLNDEIVVLPITEIISYNEFFDFKAKYDGESNEVTPADIDEIVAEKARKIVRDLYQLLDLKGIVRIDFIITGDEPTMIEINTVPGFSAMSIVPQQMEKAGLAVGDTLDKIISQAIAQNK